MIPQKTDWMKEQMEHEPTKEYSEDIYAATQKFGYEEALEIGCMWAVSTLSILLAGKGNLVSVDKSTYTHAPEEIEANGLSERWKFINLDSQDYWPQRKEVYDLVYIDGDHSYKFAHMDIAEGWKATKRGGVLLIDDVTHKNNRADSVDPYGVSLAAWEHVYNNSDIEDIGFQGRILWFKKCA